MKTKFIKISAILLIVAGGFAACENKEGKITIDSTSYFEKMNFLTSFGRFTFDLYKTNNPDYLKAIVIEYFDLTRNKVITIKRTEDNSNLFDVFKNALNNEIELLGDFEHPEFCDDGELIIGPWTFLYFIHQNETIEVTNVKLRNELLKFSEMVRNKLTRNNIKF